MVMSVPMPYMPLLEQQLVVLMHASPLGSVCEVACIRWPVLTPSSTDAAATGVLWDIPEGRLERREPGESARCISFRK